MWQIYCLRILLFVRYFRHYTLILLFISLLGAGYIIALFTITQKQLYVTMDCLMPSTALSRSNQTPAVTFYGIKPEDGSLDIVKDVFNKLGYQTENQNQHSWDILWAHTYPFHELARQLAYLKSHQKVNHFPGSGFITQKSNLAKLHLGYMPKSFQLPEEKEKFLEFAKANNHMQWVLKSSNHRSIKMIDEHSYLDVNNSFIQEFIGNPLLISNRKFDIGIYVILLSIDPLRVYIYSGDVLLRFCQKEYDAIGASSFESYIVGDDYLPIWNVPALKYLYSSLNYTAKESLNAYIQSKGKDPKQIWSQIVESIQEVYLQAEENIKKSALVFGNLRNYFELVRFDFIVDEKLKVFLLEVNMSPNLSAAHFPPNKLLYEQVLFNSLTIVGLTLKFPGMPFYRSELEVSQKDIQVYSEQCSSLICQKSCKSLKCKACNQCMDGEFKQVATAAYLEHMNKGKFRRIIPVPVAVSKKELHQGNKLQKLSTMNAFMDTWFKGKCLQEVTWCQ